MFYRQILEGINKLINYYFSKIDHLQNVINFNKTYSITEVSSRFLVFLISSSSSDSCNDRFIGLKINKEKYY